MKKIVGITNKVVQITVKEVDVLYLRQETQARDL